MKKEQQLNKKLFKSFELNFNIKLTNFEKHIFILLNNIFVT